MNPSPITHCLASALLRMRDSSHSLRNRVRAFCFRRLFLECGSGFAPGQRFEVFSPKRISLGFNFVTGTNVRLHAWPLYAGINNSDLTEALITIGSGVFINSFSYVTASYGVEIGDHCLIGSNVLISDNSHGQSSLDTRPRIQQPLSTKGKVIIGSNVWICNNAVIASGVLIGDHSIIAANSVVTKSFPPGSLIAGVPAILLRPLSAHQHFS